MNILDKDFKYVPANKTDIRKTFARIKREMEKTKQGAQQWSKEEIKDIKAQGKAPIVFNLIRKL